MRYKAVIFDMDGTILDTLEDLALTLNWALRQNGFPERTMDEVRRFVGNGIRKLVERGVPAGTEPEAVDGVYRSFTEYYRDHCSDHTKPYAGIPGLLERLRREGYRTAVVSNKADFAVQELCTRYFDGLFDTAAGDRPDRCRKPAPDTVLSVLACFGLEPHDAVYIGDSDVDVETARNAGTDCIGVAWGFRGEAFLREAGAGTVVRDTDELYEAIIKERR